MTTRSGGLLHHPAALNRDQGKDAAVDAFGEEVRHNSFQSDTPGVGDR
ncbi:MAG: hypothetical protein IPF88_17720 [Candidatus Microthrix sp.]|nr:hypothetical protein [Candidatus Microthrix sp.]MBK6440345.1 hypothetical protein [Candidatus Microthrix sp.]